MKAFFLTLLLLTGNLWAGPQDIVFKSRFDNKTSNNFIDHLRAFLINNKIGDPYQQDFKKTVTFDLSSILSGMSEDTQKWVKDLQALLKMNLVNSQLMLVIEDFGYSIEDFDSDFLPESFSQVNRVEYVTNNVVRGIVFKAEKIAFKVEVASSTNKAPLVFQLEFIRPIFRSSPDIGIELPMGWSTVIQRDHFQLDLHSIDLTKVFATLKKRPEAIDLSFEDVKLPQVSLRVGNKEVKIDHQKLNSFILERREELKRGLVNIIHANMEEKLPNVIKDSPMVVRLPKLYGINSDISAGVEFKEMRANRSRMLEVVLEGHVCDQEQSDLRYQCARVKKTRQIRKLDPENFQRSSRLINRLLIENSANMALSVSEEYINSIILQSVKVGLWDEAFEGNDFKLGPENAFILAEESGNTFGLYLDIIYRLKGAQRVLVGKSELRFPVKMKITLKIDEVSGIPTFAIRVTDIIADDAVLVRGYPEFGLTSNLNTIPRFRAKVLTTIREELAQFNNKTLMSFEIAPLKGSYFQRLNFFSDGLGRAHATINFNSHD